MFDEGTIGSFFYSGRTDSLVLDDGFIGSFRSPCTEGCDIGRAAEVRSAGGSICMGNVEGNHDRKQGLKGIEGPGGVNVDALILTVFSPVNGSTSEVWWPGSERNYCV